MEPCISGCWQIYVPRKDCKCGGVSDKIIQICWSDEDMGAVTGLANQQQPAPTTNGADYSKNVHSEVGDIQID